MFILVRIHLYCGEIPVVAPEFCVGIEDIISL